MKLFEGFHSNKINLYFYYKNYNICNWLLFKNFIKLKKQKLC